MRSLRLVTAALAIAAALGAAAPAAAVEWSALVGAGYNRTDEWASGLQRSAPGFDLNLGLTLDGSVYMPGVVDYGLGFEGRRLGDSPSDGPNVTRDYLAYRARLAFFDNPSSPLSVSVFANRQDDRVATSDALASTSFRGISNLYGADLRYRELNRPTFNAGYNRLETETTSSIVADHRTMQSYTASTSLGTQGFGYNASYIGLVSEGAFAGDSFHDHRVDAFVTGYVTDDTEARLADSYSLRTPDVTSPFAPRQELNSLQAYVTTHLKLPDLQRATYSYAHGLQSAPGNPDFERTTHQAGYNLQRTLTPEWRLASGLDASYDEGRTATGTRRDAGQSVSVVGMWTRAFTDGTAFVSFGPRVGVLEPDGQDAKLGYGGTVTANTSLRRGLSDYTAAYAVTYADDVGVEGTSFTQSAQVSAQTPVHEALLRGQLNFSSQRRYGTPFVAGALRTVDLNGTWLWRTFSVAGTVSVMSGLSNAVKDPGSGDGLFLALPYDQHTVMALLTANAQLTRWLDGSASARYSVVDYADRPTTTETELRAALHYAVGALRVTFDERYVISEALGQNRRINVFFVLLSRAFGSRF
jgi:hypothetical protein